MPLVIVLRRRRCSPPSLRLRQRSPAARRIPSDSRSQGI